MKQGVFITLEGPDGCGKTTQAKMLVECLKKRGFPVLHTREPGGTSFAENLRTIILNPDYKIAPMAELMLYEASRAQHAEEVIRPALKKGLVVICERYTDATLAYQGYGRKIDLKVIRNLNGIATGNLNPELTVVLDVPSDIGLARARKIKHGARGDRMERESRVFHERVRQGYFKIAKSEPRRVQILSAGGTIEEVHQQLCKVVLKKLEALA
jgi:dTMP kinase